MMSSAQTATAVHEADTAAKAMFPPDLPSLHRLTVRARLRLDRAPSDVLLDLLASCDRDIYSETCDAAGMDPLAASPCPTCSGPIRETVGMVCQTCGTDYAALGTEQP